MGSNRALDPGGPRPAGRHRADDGGAPAAGDARPAARRQHQPVRAGGAGRHRPRRLPEAVGVPVPAADHHHGAAGPERLVHPADPAERVRRQGHRDLRQLRGRWLGPGRAGRLPDPDRDPVRGHHGRRGAGCRGRGAVRPRRHAGQADGDRRRPGRRTHRRGRGTASPPAHRHRVRLLRRDGRRLEVRQGRRHRRHRDRGHQPARRVRHRRGQPGDAAGPGHQHLRAADHRRRPGLADPGPAHLRVHRPAGQPRGRGRRRPRPAAHPPAPGQRAADADRRRRAGPDGRHPGPSQGPVPADRGSAVALGVPCRRNGPRPSTRSWRPPRR